MVSGNWHLADAEKRPPFPAKNIDVHNLYLAAETFRKSRMKNPL